MNVSELVKVGGGLAHSIHPNFLEDQITEVSGSIIQSCAHFFFLVFESITAGDNRFVYASRSRTIPHANRTAPPFHTVRLVGLPMFMCQYH